MSDKNKVFKTDGSTINQPHQFPTVVHTGHRADGDSIRRTKKRPLLRRYAAQQIAKLTKLARRIDPNAKVVISKELEAMAARPDKRKRR